MLSLEVKKEKINFLCFVVFNPNSFTCGSSGIANAQGLFKVVSHYHKSIAVVLNNANVGEIII